MRVPQRVAAGAVVGGGRPAACRGGTSHAWAFVTEQAYLRGPDDRGGRHPHLPAGAQGGQADPAVPGARDDRRATSWSWSSPCCHHGPGSRCYGCPHGLAAVPFLAAAGRPDGQPARGLGGHPGRVRAAVRGVPHPRAGGPGHRRAEPRGCARTRSTAVVPIAADHQGRATAGSPLYDLPHGVTAGEVSERRERLASGLRRPLGCVWPETMHKRHPGALNLYVADEDMTEGRPARPGRWPGAAPPTCSSPW